MIFENQIVSLELSKELKKLGVKQESLFFWIYAQTYAEVALIHPQSGQDVIFFDERNRVGLGHYGHALGLSSENYSAFTVAELGELLPQKLEYQFSSIGTRDVNFETGKIYGEVGWFLYYIDRPNNYIHCNVSGETEADARAKMLIYLIKHKLLKI